MSDKIVGMLGYEMTLDMHDNDFFSTRSNFGFCSRRRRRRGASFTAGRGQENERRRTPTRVRKLSVNPIHSRIKVTHRFNYAQS